jgi:hypothetical protein
MDGGSVIGTGTASGGVWTISSTHLADGAHSIYAVETDGDQPPSAPSASLTIVIDTTRPEVQPQSAPIGTVAANGATSFGVSWTSTDSGSSVASASVARDSRPLVAGTCVGSWTQDHGNAAGTSPFDDAGLALATCYRWRVTAVDAAGNAGTATTGTVTLGDIAITSLADGDPVFSVETLSALAQSANGITRVEFLADGTQLGDATSSPFSATWDTVAAGAGDHTLQARLVRGDGSTVLAPAIKVTVDNTLPSDDRVALDRSRGRLTDSQSALYRVFASAAQALLPPRYQSSTATTASDSVSVLTPAEYALLNATDKGQVDDIWDQDLRGIALMHPVGTTVGREDSYYRECTHVASWIGWGTTYYCVHMVPGFKIVYWIDNGWYGGGVEDTDHLSESINADGSLVGTPDQVPDTVNTVTVALQSAQARYRTMGYRIPQGTQYVILRPDVPCGEGCTEKLPLMPAPEISLYDKLGTTIGTTINLDQWWTPRHEYFHAVQDQYTIPWELCRTEFCRDDENAAWAEGTAEWASHQVDENALPAQRINSYAYSSNLASYLDHPELPFEKMQPAYPQHQYGLFIIASFLEESHGVDAVRRTWERMADGHSALDAIGMEDPGGLTTVLGEFAAAANSMSFSDHDNWFLDDTTRQLHPYSWVGRLQTTGGRPARTPASPVQLNTGSTRVLTDLPDLGTGGFSLTDLRPTDPAAGVLEVDLAGPFGSVSSVGAELVPIDQTTGAKCAPAAQVSGGRIQIYLAVGTCRTVTLVLWNTDHWPEPVAASATFTRGAIFDDFRRTVSGAWGGATPSGAPYSTMTYSGSGRLSVASGAGFLTGDPGSGMSEYTGSSIAARVSPTRGEMSGDFNMLVEFEIDSLASSPLMYIGFYSGSTWLTEADIQFDNSSGEVWFWAQSPRGSKTDWKTGTRYRARINRVAATGLMSVRVWAVGDPEPTTWMASTTVTTNPGAFEVGLHNYSRTSTTNTTVTLTTRSIVFDSVGLP